MTAPPSSPMRTLRVPDIAWVEIPAGPFVYQDGERRELPTFWIARYPVTNLQYQTFIDDGGYRNDRWWRDLERRPPEEPRWPQPNRPRTNVNWYEAVAFTRWLNARLGLAEGNIRLPTEQEWEKAARGTEGLIYPWGNEYQSGCANIDEAASGEGPWHVGQPVAVGLFPQGQSPFGVEDLSGNVWEWCLNEYDQPALAIGGGLYGSEPFGGPLARDDQAYIAARDSAGDWRGLRGGSWFKLSGDARPDYLNRSRPGARSDDFGFRVVSAVTIGIR